MASLIDKLAESPQRPTWAEIDLNNLASNFNEIRNRVGDVAKVMAVVKANAYGHGAVQCARRLVKEGAEWFGVALPEEGIELRAAGVGRVVAIYGVHGWRWTWVREVKELVFALDADTAGQRAWHSLARAARLRGKRVSFLPPEAYGGHKDVSDAWAAGRLSI